ncbi:MAG: hypothetical protein V5A68_08425 [Candidatus Thermoplasmatota archaeon]
MEFIYENTIVINRELSDLDKFTIDFINVLKKHTKYVIVSGYVSILLGMARASEYVDFQILTSCIVILKTRVFIV